MGLKYEPSSEPYHQVAIRIHKPKICVAVFYPLALRESLNPKVIAPNTLRNERFRGGLVFKAHRLCVSLNSRLQSNEEEEEETP